MSASKDRTIQCVVPESTITTSGRSRQLYRQQSARTQLKLDDVYAVGPIGRGSWTILDQVIDRLEKFRAGHSMR